MDKNEIEGIMLGVLQAWHKTRVPIWRDWRWLMGFPTAVIAFGTIWLALGFPTIATSADIARIERERADLAIQVYQNMINNLIATTPTKDAPPAQQKAWEQQLNQANRNLERAIEKKSILTTK